MPRFKNSFIIICSILSSLCCCKVLQAQPLSFPADSLKKALIFSKDDTSKVRLLNRLANGYVKINGDSVLKYTHAAITLSEQLKYALGKGNALINIAFYYESKGKYPLAIENSIQALHQYEIINNIERIANANILLAQLSKDISGQSRTDEYIERGIVYAKRAYEQYKNLNDTSGIAYSLNEIGILQRDKAISTGNFSYYDSANNNYLAAKHLIAESAEYVTIVAKLDNNLSQVCSEYKKDYHEALQYLSEAVAINRNNNNKSGLSYNYGNISEDYIKLKMYDSALRYAENMLLIASDIHLPYRIHDALQQLYGVYDARKQYDSALHYFKRATALNDSLTDIAKTSQVMDLQAQYESRQKEQEIKLLNIEADRKNRKILTLVAILILLACIATWMMLIYERVRKQKRQITQQSARLEIMMKELHHRVKNNLQIVSSLLGLQIHKMQDEAVAFILEESRQRVQAMSLIHQRLYKMEELTSVNMKEYVSELAETLLSAYGFNREDLKLDIDVKKEIIDVDKALPIGLILNELVTNALKYAYKNIADPVLLIHFGEDAANILLVVKDNGIGLNEKAWRQETDSFGKQLIELLTNQLRGNYTILINDGTKFTVIIPKDKKD